MEVYMLSDSICSRRGNFGLLFCSSKNYTSKVFFLKFFSDIGGFSASACYCWR